ncbi:MAG: T9SS type A sorting domain-containing protein, partial [Ferruginibacter sp.]
ADGQEITNIAFVLKANTCSTNGEISYCFSKSIDPANTLTFVFQDPITTVINDCTFSGGTLPITISSFAAARKGNVVNLQWKTASESNAKEFILQKKTGSTFVDFATVAATNLSNGAAYSYVDNNTTKGITEYRLKLVDQDNSFKTSEIRSIKGTGASSEFTIYPNPSTGVANVVLSETFEKASIQLMDNAGRTIRTENLQNNNSTNFRSLTPGNYMIRVTNTVTGEAVTKKLTVIK